MKVAIIVSLAVVIAAVYSAPASAVDWGAALAKFEEIEWVYYIFADNVTSIAKFDNPTAGAHIAKLFENIALILIYPTFTRYHDDIEQQLLNATQARTNMDFILETYPLILAALGNQLAELSETANAEVHFVYNNTVDSTVQKSDQLVALLSE